MTKICKIKLYGGLRQKAGRAEQRASGATVRAALGNLCAGNDDLRAAIFDGDILRPHVRVMVNGRDIHLGPGLETAVADNDQIAIFPPIAGG